MTSSPEVFFVQARLSEQDEKPVAENACGLVTLPVEVLSDNPPE